MSDKRPDILSFSLSGAPSKTESKDLAELYEHDFHAWLERNLQLIRNGRLSSLDFQNIAEELDGLAKRDQREIKSRMRKLIHHLLKWGAQPNRRSKSWDLTIRDQRNDLKDLLAQSPSLEKLTRESPEQVYERAVANAMVETGLPRDKFPADCPFTYDQLMNMDYKPDTL